jgi:cobalt-zinc-cadmium efflux system outer membrane protein
MNKRTLALFICAALFANPIQGLAQGEEETLLPVYQIVLVNNPDIKIAIGSIMHAKGSVSQANLRPNPKAVIEVENFGGENGFSGFDGAEITFGFEQEIEILGKRSYRRDVARHGLAMAQHEVYSSILATLANAHQSYVEFIIAKERLNLAEKRMELSDKTHVTVKNRVSAAAASEIQHTKVDIEQEIAAIEKFKAQENLASARAQLERLLSTSSDKISSNKDILSVSFNLPHKAELITALNALPQVEVMKLKELQSKSNVNLAKAHRIPNPTIGFGLRHFKDSNSNAFLANFSMPIPVFDRNQGNLAQAQAEKLRASHEARSVALTLRESAEKVYEQLVSTSMEVSSYRSSIIPNAQKAYNQATEGYNSGRFSFLELLDAQRTLYEIQETYLDSLLRYHQAKAQVNFLLGVNKNLVKNIIYLNN